jgi:hypothetical protein
MENEEKRDCGAAGGRNHLLEKTLNWLEERQGALERRGGEDFGNRGAEPAGERAGREAGGAEKELAR